MTSIFSTIINFGMLGLLRRLHRLQIQLRLQAHSKETGIVYPQILKYQWESRKCKHRESLLNDVTNSKIYEAILKANAAAKACVERLGMVDLLKKHKVWSTIPSGNLLSEVPSDNSDEDNFSETLN